MWGIRVIIPIKLRNKMLDELHVGHIGIRGWRGDNKKIAKEQFGLATPGQKTTPGKKTTESNIKKKLGIGSPVFCIIFVTLILHRPVLNRYGQDRSKGKRWALCIGSLQLQESLLSVRASNAQPLHLN